MCQENKIFLVIIISGAKCFVTILHKKYFFKQHRAAPSFVETKVNCFGFQQKQKQKEKLANSIIDLNLPHYSRINHKNDFLDIRRFLHHIDS